MQSSAIGTPSEESSRDDASDHQQEYPSPSPPLSSSIHSPGHDSSNGHDKKSKPIRPPSVKSSSSYTNMPINRLVNHSRQHSGYSNFSTMSETSLPWTTGDIGFNAISGVLNDPSRRGQSSTRPSKTDIPPAPHASIPKVKASAFDSYLALIAPVFERYKYNKFTDESSGAMSPTASQRGVDDDPSRKAHQQPSSRNPYSLPHLVLSSESLISEPARELPMLENVPSTYFDEDFALENPRVFQAVCEGADIVSHQGTMLPSSANTLLQEKLSYYLDIVEVHLMHEIENRSEAFFEALSNLQALHDQTRKCVAQIHRLRQKVKQSLGTECKEGLEVVRLQVRRRNLERLHSVISAVKDIRSSQPMIQELLGKGDYFGALDLINETRNALANAPELKHIRAIVNFDDQLREMNKAVDVMIQHDFLSILLSDLSFRLETMDLSNMKDVLSQEKADSIPLDVQDLADLEERLGPSMLGLLRTEMVSATLRSYKDQLLSEINVSVGKVSPLSNTSNTADGSGSSADRAFKSVPFDTFFQVLMTMCATLFEFLCRVAANHQLILRLVDRCGQRHSKDKEHWLEWRQGIESESADIVTAVTEFAHKQCGKLTGFRSDQNALLNPIDFYRLNQVLQNFIKLSESLCGQTCAGLRGTVISQQRAFIDHFHMERVKQESQLIENEQWVASEVPSDFQLIVDRICDKSISSFTSESQDVIKDTNTKSTKLLNIHESHFYVVGCGLLIIKMLEDYLRCILSLQDRAGDIVQHVIDLLKLFNSRVRDVILGAGAMRSAGLNNITAKHLALASQSLKMIINLIPFLKNCIAPHLSEKYQSVLDEFDKMIKDYTEHQEEIHLKLVSIMNERFTVHIKGMQNMQWDDNKDPESSYMRTLVKETTTLHKVLRRYLPSDNLQFVMGRVFESFTIQFTEEVPKLKIQTVAGKERLARDASYFIEQLSSLQGIQPPSNTALETVQALPIEKDEPLTEP